MCNCYPNCLDKFSTKDVMLKLVMKMYTKMFYIEDKVN